eukprot:3273685-Amphidinium_carterae.1
MEISFACVVGKRVPLALHEHAPDEHWSPQRALASLADFLGPDVCHRLSQILPTVTWAVEWQKKPYWGAVACNPDETRFSPYNLGPWYLACVSATLGEVGGCRQQQLIASGIDQLTTTSGLRACFAYQQGQGRKRPPLQIKSNFKAIWCSPVMLDQVLNSITELCQCHVPIHVRPQIARKRLEDVNFATQRVSTPAVLINKLLQN